MEATEGENEVKHQRLVWPHTSALTKGSKDPQSAAQSQAVSASAPWATYTTRGMRWECRNPRLVFVLHLRSGRISEILRRP